VDIQLRTVGPAFVEEQHWQSAHLLLVRRDNATSAAATPDACCRDRRELTPAGSASHS
jgi:hypothetical protein